MIKIGYYAVNSLFLIAWCIQASLHSGAIVYDVEIELEEGMYDEQGFSDDEGQIAWNNRNAI